MAQIGLQTAIALSYAHARGVVHRDIKPSNLLLDAAGVVWVTDFGLAKTGDLGMTQTGDILGTIRYMAPERCRGQCDARSDVYALGLTLYELLALKPAFAAADRLSLIEQIRRDEPAPPRSVDPKLPRDLETIVLKAIDKDPRRRYQSADELGEDLQRFLADEPVRARRAWLMERLGRWVRRNQAVAAALGVTAAVVILLLAGGFYYNVRLQAVLREAVRERNITQSNLEDLVFGLQDNLGETSTTRALRQSLLLTAISGLEDIARRTAAAKPDLSRAVAHRKLGDIFRQIGRADDAPDQYERSRRLAEKLLGEPCDPGVADCLAKAYLGLGQLSVMGRHAEALQLREETLGLRKAKLGPDHPDTLQSQTLVVSGLVLSK